MPPARNVPLDGPEPPGSQARRRAAGGPPARAGPAAPPLRLPDAAPHAEARGFGGEPQAQAPRLRAAWPASPSQAAQEAAAASDSDDRADPAERALAGRLHVRPAGGHLDHRGRLALFLDELGKAAAHPKAVVRDNGPELTSKAMRFWSERSGAALNFIQPGKPTQNAFVESFNGKFRDSCLNQHWFRGLADVRRIVDDWRHHCDHERPHSSLGYSTPAERAKQAA